MSSKIVDAFERMSFAAHNNNNNTNNNNTPILPVILGALGTIPKGLIGQQHIRPRPRPDLEGMHTGICTDSTTIPGKGMNLKGLGRDMNWRSSEATGRLSTCDLRLAM